MYGGRVYGKGSASPTKQKRAETSAAASSSNANAPADDGNLDVGDKVDHKTFGIGKVVAIEGDKISVFFAKSGQTKKLLKGYAPIVKICQ